MGGIFWKKNAKKKMQKNTKENAKILLFFGGIASIHPNDPPSIKLALNSSIYSQGAHFLQGKIPIGYTGICHVRGWAKTGRSAPAIPFS